MLTVPIDDNIVPDGYEPVRIGFPRRGELFFVQRQVHSATFDFEHDSQLIVRPIWKPPAWLKPGWIASNKGGVWLWFDQKPEFRNGEYWAIGDTCPVIINTRMLEFTPPPFTDPATSLREIR